jgi:hypothetical protein
MIFAREVSDPLTSLVKKLDACTSKHSDARMGSFVVFMTDEEGFDKKLKELAEKDKIDHTILSIDNKAGPKAYKISKDADVTVILYAQRDVKANHAFKKGEMKDSDVEKIIADVKKILPE